MSYTITKVVEGNITEVEEKTRNSLKNEGFGILTEIDVKKTIKTKLDKDIPPYKILGACNPPFAYQALQAEPRIGTMLPCNVILRDMENGSVEVSAVDPVASMMAVKNPGLAGVADQIQKKLQQAIGSIK